MPYSFGADGTLIEDADGLYNQYGMQIYTQVMGVSAKLACPEVEHANGHKLFMEGAECDECAPGTGTVYNPTTQKCECPEGTVWDDAYNTCVVSGEVEEKEEEVTEEQEEIFQSRRIKNPVDVEAMEEIRREYKEYCFQHYVSGG